MFSKSLRHAHVASGAHFVLREDLGMHVGGGEAMDRHCKSDGEER